MGSAAYPAFPVGYLGFRATSEQKDNAKCAKKAVWDYINRLRIDEGYERREQHDASFLATAENVINAFAGYGDYDSSFGFGNAQKLINMTAKYIALGIYMDDCREGFQYCHCPMDGIMVDKVTKLAGRLVDEGGRRTPCFAGEFRIQAPTCPRLGGQGRSPLEQADPREPKTIRGFPRSCSGSSGKRGVIPA